MARPTSRGSPAFSSANPAIASKPRYESTATEMAPITTDGIEGPEPDERRQRGARRAGRGQRRQRHDDEDDEDRDLDDQHDRADASRHPHADQVERGRGGERDHREDPRRHRGHQGMKGDAREQVGDRRNQQVVQHRQPAREEPGRAAEPFGGVGEHRTGMRHDPRHLGVRPGGEGHRDGGQHVDERDGAVGAGVQHAEHAHRRQRPDEQQPVDDEIAKRERASENGPRQARAL